METKKGLGRRWIFLAVFLGVALVVGLVAAAFFAGRASGGSADGGNGGQPQVSARPSLGEDGRIGYATSGVVATEPETFQDVVDQMYENARQPGIALQFKNLMVSDDGVNFACFIGNSEDNAYDMFISIYADEALTEELFLSELLRPGTRFEQVTFQKKLDPGEYTGYLVFTQVEDEKQSDDTYLQVIRAQVPITINIVVNE